MPDLFDFLPLRVETVASVRARMDAAANAGLAPDDPRYLDLTPGGFYWDNTQPAAIEIARLWDFASTELLAAMFVRFAFGFYLDEHGATLGVVRKPAAKAVGTVTFTGTNGTFIATGFELAQPVADPDDEPFVFLTTASGTITGGTLVLAVEAEEEGTAYNAAASTVTVTLSNVEGVSGVTNAAAISGGVDVESDESYQNRLLLEYSTAQGGGTVADYERWTLAYPEAGFVTVQPLTNAAGTYPTAGNVRVVVTDPTNSPVSAGFLTILKNDLDPIAGEGRGRAPIGAIVHTATVTLVPVTVSAVVTHRTGFTLDGTVGTLPTRAEIEKRIREYLNTLPPDEDVILNHVESLFFGVRGVYNVANVLLNGVAANVTITGLQVARSSTITLT